MITTSQTTVEATLGTASGTLSTTTTTTAAEGTSPHDGPKALEPDDGGSVDQANASVIVVAVMSFLLLACICVITGSIVKLHYYHRNAPVQTEGGLAWKSPSLSVVPSTWGADVVSEEPGVLEPTSISLADPVDISDVFVQARSDDALQEDISLTFADDECDEQCDFAGLFDCKGKPPPGPRPSACCSAPRAPGRPIVLERGAVSVVRTSRSAQRVRDTPLGLAVLDPVEDGGLDLESLGLAHRSDEILQL